MDAFVTHLTHVFATYFDPPVWTLHGGHYQDIRENTCLNIGVHVYKAQVEAVAEDGFADSSCRARRCTRMLGGNKSQQHLPPFREIVADVANNWLFPAVWMPDNILIRGASDEANNDITLHAKSMLSRGGLQMATGPPRLWPGSQPEALAFEFPFRPNGALRTIIVRWPEWEAQRVINSFISLPTVRDDDPDMVCYNGSIMQIVKITECL